MGGARWLFLQLLLDHGCRVASAQDEESTLGFLPLGPMPAVPGSAWVGTMSFHSWTSWHPSQRTSTMKLRGLTLNWHVLAMHGSRRGMDDSGLPADM
ncbi:SPATA4 [Symbiodinium necroappetens]|uniref:SPATA4 protein n=1 Tax=Symbiodinium necroappetens TaxID=1628268 RepID=A0A812P8W5_9DINO|nr:SPATA4 [Symbiodinium necroappetens]